MEKDVMVKCRVCGRMAKSSQYVLDSHYKMMVCPLCIKEKGSKLAKEKKALDAAAAKKAPEAKPAGWDQDDEMLEKAYRQKQQSMVKAEPMEEGKVKYTCPRCKYTFVYDTFRKYPANCPYCTSEIFRFRM